MLAVNEDDLRSKERWIISEAIRGVPTELLRSETLDWAERIVDRILLRSTPQVTGAGDSAGDRLMAVALPGYRRLQVERFAKFGLVGLLGFGLNLIVQAMLTEGGGLNYVVAAILATQVSSTVNFVLAERWVFSPDRREGRGKRYLAFLAMNNAALVLRVPIMWVLTSVVGVQYSLSNAVSLVVLMLVRFGLADNLIWRESGGEEADGSSVLVTTPSVAATGLAFAMAGAGSATVAPTLDPGPPPGSASALPGPASADLGDSPSETTADAAPSASEAWSRPFPGQRWMLGAIVLAGAFLRTWQITAVGFNSDETVYAGQAAAIAGDKNLTPFFPVIRAHPLLFQGILSILYRFGTSELAGRLAAAAFGVGTVLAAYAVARLLYGSRTALIAALFVALMPYQVIVNRQVLLDGPTAFFATVTLYLLARYALSQRSGWLIASAGAAGVTVLSKETSVVLVVAMFAFLALSPGHPRPLP